MLRRRSQKWVFGLPWKLVLCAGLSGCFIAMASTFRDGTLQWLLLAGGGLSALGVVLEGASWGRSGIVELMRVQAGAALIFTVVFLFFRFMMTWAG